MDVKIIENERDLKRLFNFLSELFYDEAREHNEHYYTMSERYTEMKNQFEKDNELLLYIENNGKIVAGLTSKNINDEKKKITLGVMAVDKNHRRKGYASALVEEFEKRCKDKGILHIDLGARIRACPLYQSLGYTPSLMVQVFDFNTIEEVKNANTLNLEEGFSWQGDTYGFIFFKVDEIKEKYIKHFEDSVKTAQAQYIFEKNL